MDELLPADAIDEAILAVETLDADDTASRVRRGVAFARRKLLQLEFVQRLIQHDAVLALLDRFGRDLIPVRGVLFDKTGAANWTVPWHQDRSIAVKERIAANGFGPWSSKGGVTHVQPPLDVLRQMLTLRMHLDPCGPENGPLRVIGGTQDRILDAGEVERISSTAEQTICATKRGGAVLMRPLVLHASSPAEVSLHRRVVHLEFGPKSLGQGLEWAIS